MILKSRETTIAYRCPYCGMSTVSIVGVFTLSGDMLKLKCNCGKSDLTITYTSDRKIRLSVPCLICPTPHNYVISSSTFFEKDIFTLACTYTAIDICFIGSRDAVFADLKRSEIELNKMLAEAGLDDFDTMQDDSDDQDEYIDPEIEEIIHFMLIELDDEGKISCECEDHDDSLYDFDFVGENVHIYCANCGAYKELPMSGGTHAADFIKCDELILQKHSSQN